MSCLRLAMVALTSSAISVARAQAPSGYHLGPIVPIPDSLVESLARGRFKISVRRVAQTPQERQLLELAERLYPDSATIVTAASANANLRKEVEASASGLARQNYTLSPRPAGNPAHRWWFFSVDATWVPFAVTSGAVDYYLGRIQDLAADKNQLGLRASDKGSLRYIATVRQTIEAGAVFEVDLELTWDYWCGYLCAISFTHRRRVLFDANGGVIRISGDVPPLAVAS